MRSTVSHSRRPLANSIRATALTTPKGDQVTVAFDAETHLPAWMSWVGPDPNLGDLTYKTTTSAIRLSRASGSRLGTTRLKIGGTYPWRKLYIDKYELDTPANDLAALPPSGMHLSPRPVLLISKRCRSRKSSGICAEARATRPSSRRKLHPGSSISRRFRSLFPPTLFFRPAQFQRALILLRMSVLRRMAPSPSACAHSALKEIQK